MPTSLQDIVRARMARDPFQDTAEDPNLRDRLSSLLELFGGGLGGMSPGGGGGGGGGTGGAAGSAAAGPSYIPAGPGIDPLSGQFNFDTWTQDFPNARIPYEEMTRLGQGAGTDIFLRPDMAANFRAFRRFAAEEGQPLAAREGYRDWNAQAAADARHGPGLAAPPGRSNHGIGVAVDLANYDHDWVAENAEKFGLYQPMSWEPWHWQLRTAESGGHSPGEAVPTFYSDPAIEMILERLAPKESPARTRVPGAGTRYPQRRRRGATSADLSRTPAREANNYYTGM